MAVRAGRTGRMVARRRSRHKKNPSVAVPISMRLDSELLAMLDQYVQEQQAKHRNRQLTRTTVVTEFIMNGLKVRRNEKYVRVDADK